MAQKRDTQKFDINGETLSVLRAEGPGDLTSCLLEIQEDAVSKFQNSTKGFNPFRMFSHAEDKPGNSQVILYINRPPQPIHGPEQRSLIVANGKDHYFYDLVRAAAPSDDVKTAYTAAQVVLGPQSPHLFNVSGEETKKNYEKRQNDPNAFAEIRESIAKNLPKDNLPAAIGYALQQIKVAQVELEQANRAGFRR